MTGPRFKPRSAAFAVGMLLLVVPWLFLLNRLESLSQEEEETLETEYRQALLTEHEDFLRELEPAEFLRLVHEEMDTQAGFLSQREGAVIHPEKDVDPQVMTRKFLSERDRLLRRRFGLQPMLLLVTDTDLRNIWWKISPGPDCPISLSNLPPFARALSRALSGAWIPWLVSTPSMWIDEATIARRYGFPNFGNMRKRVSQEFGGDFWNRDVREGTVHQSFSEKLGRQQIFLVSRFLSSAPRAPRSTFGGYLAVFGEKLLPRKAILLRTLRNTQHAPLLRRSLDRVPVGRSLGFSRAGGVLRFQGSLPSSYHGVVTPTRSGFRTVLGVTIARPPGDNRLRTLSWWVWSLGGSSLLAAFAGGALWTTRQDRMALSVRWKLALVLGAVILLPMLSLGVVSLRLIHLSQREIPRRVISLARNRCRHLAARIRERMANRMLANNRAKAALTDLARASPEAFSRTASAAWAQVIDGEFGLLLLRDGSGGWFGDAPARRLKNIYKAMAKTLLGDLGAWLRKGEENADLVQNDFLDSLWSFNNAFRGLAMEGMESRSIFHFREDERMAFFLLGAGPTTDPAIAGLVFMRLHAVVSFEHLLDTMSQREPRSFFLENPWAEVEFGVLPYTNSAGKGFGWPPWVGNIKEFREIADSEARTRATGEIQRLSGNRLLFQTWEGVGDVNFLVAGVVRLRSLQALSGLAASLLGFLVLFGAIVTLLMGDLLSYLFIAPVRVLSEGANRVGMGVLPTRVEIRTNDEFHELEAAFNRMSEGIRQREKLRRFVPDRLVQRVIASGPQGSGRGLERVEVVMLASDIRGFTTLGERIPPEILVETLNDYFTAMEEAITAEGGMVWKLVGDAILAIFFPPSPGMIPAAAAVRAARGMRARLAGFNRRRAHEGLFPLENGIGLARGPILAVELGHQGGRRDFTVIGSLVGQATHLESLTSHPTRSRIIVSPEVFELLPEKSGALPVGTLPGSPPEGWEIPET